MKIVYLSNAAIPSRTANSVHVMSMCAAFAALNNKVVLFAPTIDDGNNSHINIDVYDHYNVPNNFAIQWLKMPQFRGRFVVYSLRMLYHLLKINPDIVYGRNLDHCYLAQKAGYKTTFEAHSLIGNKARLARFYFKGIVQGKNFNKIVVISQALKKMYMRAQHLGSLSAKNILVHHDATLIPQLKPYNKQWVSRKEALQVGYAGHLYQGRGMEVIKQLAEQLPDVDFHIAGGMDDDIQRWKKIITNSNIIFHGYIQQKHLAAWRHNCDILIAPYQKILSVYSGGNGATMNTAAFMSPLKIFEYMSSKRAMIVSDLPVLREVLNSSNAVLVDPEDITAWVSAINMLRDSNIRQQIATQAFIDCCANYTWEVRARKILEHIT